MRYFRLLSFALAVVIAVICGAGSASAQSDSGTITGRVTDSSGAIVAAAQVDLTNIDRGTVSHASSNASGIYVLPGVAPGRYNLSVSHAGFRQVDLTNLVVNVQANIEQNFNLSIGSVAESVTVNGDGQSINTTDASVGAVIDRKFVEEIPLNGRSFQSLIMLSPGVLSASPQGTDGSSGGEFSVNGLRTNSNNFMLDGVSAMNAAATGFSRVTSSGSSSSSTVLGTTQAIISIDALQEFRIVTSNYSAEFGRMPGAQISFTSRSGTNQYHGTAFDYLRNYAFDANNWFNTRSTPALQRPQERQNDYGGVLGGPLTVPKLFSGRDRAFFFFSYEGLRLQQPIPATISYVPSNGTYNTATYANPLDKNLRANAPAALQPVLNGFPKPNCSTAQNAQCIDYGDGLSPYIFSGTAPSTIDAIMARVDYQLLSWLRVFARYSDAESSSRTFGSYGDVWSVNQERTRTYLLGVDSVFNSSITNQLRLQYSPAYVVSTSTGQPQGGSQPVVGPQGPNLNTMQGMSPVGGKTSFELVNFSGGESATITGWSYGSRQFQPNVVDSVSWIHGRHVFKAGMDYRQTTAYIGDGYLSYSPTTYYEFTNSGQVRSNLAGQILTTNNLRQNPTSKNLGLFFQDEWRLLPRLSLSLGLRWDLNPPPSVSGAQQYTYTGNINNPSSLALSRLGAPMYKTTYTDFAPRVGMALQIRNQPGRELVLRAGGGLFYDTGQSSIYGTYGAGDGVGAANHLTLTNTTFPLQASTILAPVNQTPAGPYALAYIVSPDFVPPSAVQWNTSLEQALGQKQSVTLSYVGTEGRNLSLLTENNLTKVSTIFSEINQYVNGPGSNYNALQVQYKRQAFRGLQVLAGYTWAHAIDYDSSELPTTGTGESPQRGNSDHDVRHNVTAAVVYNLPSSYTNRFERAALGYWSLDLRFVARTGFPVQVQGALLTDAVSGQQYYNRLNYNGANPYVHKSGIPGGRQFNPAVFSVPLAGQIGNAPRNFLRGFGEQDTGLSIQRVFPIYDQVHLQFRAEAFNVFNHPNFGAISASCGATAAGAVCTSPVMGQATNSLSSALGTLSSIYQQGGPRSLQLALKLQF